MKVVQILKHLDKSELQRAKDFMASVYFKHKPETQKLFNAILEGLDNKVPINNNSLWRKIYSKKTYNDLTFRKCVHGLLNSLQEFFIIEQVLSDENAKINFLASFCESHNIVELKNKLDKRLNSTPNNLSSSNAVFNIYSAKRSLIDIEGVFEQKKGLSNAEITKNKFDDLNSHVEAFYLIEKIRLALVQNNYSELTGVQFGDQNEDILNLISPKLREKFDLLEVYYQVYNLLVNDTSDLNIDDFISFLSHSNNAEFKVSIELYDNLNNYYARKNNAGGSFAKEPFKLLKFGIESKILLRFNELDPTDYRNIVFNACRVSEYDWGLKFIEEFKSLLSPEHRQSGYSFSKARIFNNMGNHEGVIDVLRNVEYEDITYNLNSRLMLIMAFYELDEYDTLDSTIKSFKVFLRRKRNVSVKRKANFSDFCDVVYNLVRAGDRKDVDRFTKAKDILAANAGIPSSWWLKEKIEIISDKLGIPKQDQPAT